MGISIGMGMGWVCGQKFRPHGSPADIALSVRLCVSVCLCPLVATVSSTKTAEPIEVPVVRTGLGENGLKPASIFLSVSSYQLSLRQR